MIEVKGITKDFADTRALDDVTLTVRDGVAYGLLGRNGAGKTTTIRIIMNIFKADKGEVLINGARADKGRFKIGYLPEERGLYPKRTVIEQMIYIGKLRGLNAKDAQTRAEARLAQLQATEYTQRKLETLSKGNQQKIQLAIALMNDPDILILDEPFSGLDPVNARLLKDAIRAEADKGKTVIFSSHQMPQVEEFCDDICILNRGKIEVEGNLENIKASYPRNTIEIEIDGRDTQQLARTVSDRLAEKIRRIESKAHVLTVELVNPDYRANLLGALEAEQIIPSRFAVKLPSLEDIFVEKVGQGSEEDIPEDEDKGKKKRRGRRK
jgi:ABC-2 type transport system ATP-binding protein